MPVRTKELGRLTAINDATERVVYTVPAGRTAIVKDVALSTVSTTRVALRAKRAGTGAVIWQGQGPDAVGGLPSRSLWCVLEAGDELTAKRENGSSAYDLHVSGTELEGVAP